MNNDGNITETLSQNPPLPHENDTTADAANQFGTAALSAEENKQTPHAKKKKLPREVKEFIIRIAATIIAVWLMLTFLFGVYMCHSDTCYPMVKDGDLCVTWRPEAPAQGDLIVYKHNEETRFGRVTAVSGDRVEIIDGVIWVNGYIAREELLYNSSNGVVEAKFPLTVPENSVFVLSDNIADTNDSRIYGAIPLDECCGSVAFLMRRRGF